MDEVQHWYIVFMRRIKPRTRLIHYLLKDAFSHCVMVRERPDGGTIVIDPMAWGLAVRFFEQDVKSFLVDQAGAETAILSYVSDYRNMKGYKVRGVYTCVTAVKSVLGLTNTALVQTPFSLYNFMLKSDGCTVVKPYIP